MVNHTCVIRARPPEPARSCAHACAPTHSYVRLRTHRAGTSAHVCTRVSTHAHAHPHTRAHEYARPHTHARSRKPTRACRQAHAHADEHIYTHPNMPALSYAHTHTRPHIRTHICTYARTYILEYNFIIIIIMQHLMWAYGRCAPRKVGGRATRRVGVF